MYELENLRWVRREREGGKEVMTWLNGSENSIWVKWAEISGNERKSIEEMRILCGLILVCVMPNGILQKKKGKKKEEKENEKEKK